MIAWFFVFWEEKRKIKCTIIMWRLKYTCKIKKKEENYTAQQRTTFMNASNCTVQYYCTIFNLSFIDIHNTSRLRFIMCTDGNAPGGDSACIAFHRAAPA